MKSRRPLQIVLIITTALALVAMIGIGAWRLHKSRTIQLFGELVTAVATDDSVVALTFDDGPAAPYTDSVLALLREERVRATFFVVGEAVARRPDLARRIVAAGHELGNHSYSHRRLVLVSPRMVRREVERTDSLIRAAGATGPIPFRPPYGKRLVVLPWYLARTGRTTVLWTLEPDSYVHDRAAIARYVLEHVRPGAIILLHVELRSRAEGRAALGPIIEDLRARGYRFVTVSELLTRRTR